MNIDTITVTHKNKTYYLTRYESLDHSKKTATGWYEVEVGTGKYMTHLYGKNDAEVKDAFLQKLNEESDNEESNDKIYYPKISNNERKSQMQIFFKYNPMGCTNTAVYIRCTTEAEAQVLSAEMDGLQDKNPNGSFGWTNDKCAAREAIAFEDRRYAMPGHYA